jgi:hypothetical protein
VPWRGPEYVGEFPTLGWLVGEWIEENCRIPDREHAGDPYRLTDEMWRFLAQHYRLKPDARPGQLAPAFHYRRSQLVRPQKWGKGPFSASIICAEAVGPVLFRGWDARGEPVGAPWSTPLIQIAANSEDQTANVYGALLPMVELGPLSELIPDVGETRINLPGGGRIDPVTSRARSRLGQRVTFVLQDETGLWTVPSGMVAVAETQRRGLAGMGGRSIETTNAWDPAEQSVAQRTAEATVHDIYRDHVLAPAGLSYRNKVERRRIHRTVYGDSHWVDLDAIEAEAAELLAVDPEQAERFFGNRVVHGHGSWLKDGLWESAAVDDEVPDGVEVAGGFDGSESDDWTALRLETRDGLLFTPRYGPDRRPTIWAPAEWGGKIPRAEVAAAWSEIFRRYKVARVYCDPRGWQSEIEALALEHGEKVVIEWATYRIVQMHYALDRFTTDLAAGSLRHDRCPTAAQHVANARRLARPGDRYILGKPSQQQKIDVAVTSVLAHEAAADARASTWGQPATAQYAYVM